MLNETSILVVAGSLKRRAFLRQTLEKGMPGVRVNVSSGFSFEPEQFDHKTLLSDVEVESHGAALLRFLAQTPLHSGTVVLADQPTVAWVRQAVRSGVNAIISRDSSAEDLRLAIESAQAGFLLLHPTSARGLIAASNAIEPEGVPFAVEHLTTRERDVLRLMSTGLGNKEIAARLGISEHTVKFHASSILGKLSATTRTEAVSQGIRRGLIEL
jgi:DNA-binding NarL/FixJ family response regulator